MYFMSVSHQHMLHSSCNHPMKLLSWVHTSQSGLDPIFPWICFHFSERNPWYSYQVHILYIHHHGLHEALVNLSPCSLMLGELDSLDELVFCAIAHLCWWNHGLKLELVRCSIDTSSPPLHQVANHFCCVHARILVPCKHISICKCNSISLVF